MNKDIDNSDLQMSEDFDSLVKHIQNTSDILQQDARLVINRNVTTRAWLTGFYIVEYEQHGKDRAKYGDNLLKRLAERLNDKSFGLASLKSYRQFYLYYPELAEPIGGYLQQRMQKSQSPIGFLQGHDNHLIIKSQSVISLLPVQNPENVSKDGFAMQTAEGRVMPVPNMLFNRLSFTHIAQLIHISDPMKRTFYAIEAMRGPWSVRELQRQIDSNYYERSGWSKKPELLANKVHNKAEKPTLRQEMVEYVTPNIDPNLFVAQYKLQLPSKEKMMEFLMNENRN